MLFRWLPGLLLILAAAGLYLLTLDNGLQPYQLLGGDLITHQYAQAQGRFSNAPGYPLFTMGGWLWFHLGRLILGPQHNPVPILSSYSTLWALVALWLFYKLALLITDRGKGGNQAIAVLVSAFYGVTYFFWYYAITSEQYSSAVAWTLAVIYLAFRWERTRRDGYLLALALLSGVALAHMLTLVLIIPPLLWFVLRNEPRLLRRPRMIAAAAGLAALPLLSYAFVYVRGAQHPEWRGVGQWATTWDWFWSFVTTRQGRDELTWSLTPFFTAEFPALIWRELSWLVLVAGLAGLAAFGRRRATFLYATLILYLVLCWIDRQGNWFQVIMPAYAIVALGLAGAADYVWHLGHRRVVPALVTLFLIMLVFYRGATVYPQANLRDRPGDTALDPGWAILADNPPAGTLVLGTLPEELALSYLTSIWHIRPDVHPGSSNQARAALDRATGPVVATVNALPLVASEVNPDARYSGLGPTLVQLHARPLTVLPPGYRSLNEEFGDGIRLVGQKLSEDRSSGEFVLAVAWQTDRRPSQDWAVSARLAKGGQQLAQQDRTHPVFGAYPFTRWSMGEVAVDPYAFRLPAGVRPDSASLVLYRQQPDGSFTNLHVATLPLAP